MPTREQHLKQAARNEKLAKVLVHTDYREWTVTVLFYAAVHYIEAFLAVQSIHCVDHAARSDKVRTIPQMREIGKQYEALRTISRQARYQAIQICDEDVNRAEQNLAAVRSQIKYVLTGKRE